MGVARDGGQNITLGLKAFEVKLIFFLYVIFAKFISNLFQHPDYGIPHTDPPTTCDWPAMNETTQRLCQRVKSTADCWNRRSLEQREKSAERKKIFVVRHVSDKLIGRTPASKPEPSLLFHNQNCCGRRMIHSPWSKSSSHLDTVSSLLRKKPHVVRSVHSIGMEPEIDPWCSTDRSYRKCESGDLIASSSSRKQEYDEYQSSPDIKVYWNNHQPDMCTVCQLYQQYFGQFYPRHSI